MLGLCKRLKKCALVLVLALCSVAGAVHADSWQRPLTMARASATGRHVVRVIPGSDMGAVFGFAGEPRGPAAKAIVYRLGADGNYAKSTEFPLLNPIRPVFVAIADSGELVTLDNWHNMGIGKSVVVVYSRDGNVVRSLGLMDIYSPAELEKFSVSTSSIWWRCSSQPWLDSESSTLEFMDKLGSSVTINLKTGKVERSPTSKADC